MVATVTPRRNRRAPIFCALPLLPALALTLAAAAACGGDGDNGTEAGESPAPPQPATITVSSSAITGQENKVLLVFASAEGGGPMARACIRITSGDFSALATTLTDVPEGDDPCADSTAETVFPDGVYTITAGVYAPPAQQPSKEWTQTVEVSGQSPVEVEIDGAELSE